MTPFAQKKKYSLTPVITNLPSHKMREKDVVGIVTFDLIGLLPTNHIICLYYNGIPEVFEKKFGVNSYIAKTTQNI